eukprot:4441169-Heterocapsa_arctica.AAC.1
MDWGTSRPSGSVWPSRRTPRGAEASQPVPLTAEKERRQSDRGRINRLIGTRPFPSSETRLFK